MQVSTFVKKANATYAADFEALPEAAKSYIINYGWRQCVADACASAKTEGEAKGLCDKRVDNLGKGIIRAERESDPVAREARRIAVEMTNAWARKGGVVLTAKEDATAEVKAAVTTNQAVYTKRIDALRVHPDVLARAEANVAAVNELDVEIDI